MPFLVIECGILGFLLLSICFIIGLDWVRDPLDRYRLSKTIFGWVPFMEIWSKLENVQERDIKNCNFLEGDMEDFKRVIFDAVKSGHDKIIQVALDKEPERVLDLKDDTGNNLYHLAALYGKSNILKMMQNKVSASLAEEGAMALKDIPANSIFNQTNQNGNNTLHLAASGGHFDCFIQLLKMAKNGPDIHFANKYGFYPLALLIEHESNHLISFINPWTQVFKLYKNVTKCDILIANEITQDSLLHLAVRSNNLSATKVLLNENTNFNAQNINGITPLHVCATFRRTAAANLIIEKSREIVVDNKGQSPFHYVAKNCGSVETFLAMRPKKLDLEVLDNLGKTPKDYACENGFSTLESKMQEIIEDHIENLTE